MSLADLSRKGYAVIDDVYSTEEVHSIIDKINHSDAFNDNFRKTNDLFAIRRFLREIPEMRFLIFNSGLTAIIDRYFGKDHFVVKSIYFDKPERSNWFVAWHQDLTISVDKKLDLPGYDLWTTKPGQYGVRPPLEILENIFTIRIHLDDTDETNGALRVIPGSHSKGIQRYLSNESVEEEICRVRSGGVMIMRPLLQHTSNRSTNNNRRRVIHIEFANALLPEGLGWAERL